MTATTQPREVLSTRQDVAERTGRGGTWAAAGVAAAVAVGIALRLHSPSALWLDESISASISAQPLGHVQAALRQDGAPPLYALLLWCWERLVGSSPNAVRALSSVFGIAALPVAALAGHRVAGRAGAVAAAVLLATSPFAIYYSTEARMYSLVVLLVLCGWLVLDDYLRAPRVWRGALIAVLTAALALTHYWCLFLIAVVAASLLARFRSARQRPDASAVAWMAAGGLLFLPWLPTFLFQSRHTGTPWGTPAPYSAVLTTIGEWAGGTSAGTSGRVLSLLLLALAGLGYGAHTATGSRLVIELRGRADGRALAVVAFGGLVLALTVGKLTGSAYAARYTSVVLPVFLLLAALGASRLPSRGRAAVLAVASVAGVVAAVPHAVLGTKTQAPVLARALRAEALPGDVVVYCPDQLGPATSRLLPSSLVQEVYPTGASPQRVDWVDYAARNRAAVPATFVNELSRRAAGHAIWLVSSYSYRTYEGQCEGVVRALTAARGQPLTLVEADRSFFEQATLRGWAPRPQTLPR